MTWETVPLGELASLNARAVKPELIPDGFPYIGLESIGRGGNIDESITAGTSGLKSAKNSYDARHILFGKLRPNLGKVARPTKAGVSSTDIYPLLPNDRVDRDYLAQFLLSPEAIAYSAGRTSGVNLPRVSWSALRELCVPLPPLSEQRRVAAILDEADALRRPGQYALSRLTALDEALLTQATSTSTSLIRLGDVIVETQNGLYKPSTSYGRGVPIIRIDSFDGRSTGISGALKRVDAGPEEIRRFNVQVGDILINRVNAMSHLGKSTLVREIDEPTVFESNMMKIRVDKSKAQADYVAAWLRSAGARAQLKRKAKQAINQASVNQADVTSLALPALPLMEQRNLVERLAAVEHRRIQESLREESLSSLFASLQHRAFRGEL